MGGGGGGGGGRGGGGGGGGGGPIDLPLFALVQIFCQAMPLFVWLKYVGALSLFHTVPLTVSVPIPVR